MELAVSFCDLCALHDRLAGARRLTRAVPSVAWGVSPCPARNGAAMCTKPLFEVREDSAKRRPDIRSFDQTTGCDHVDRSQRALSRILPRTGGLIRRSNFARTAWCSVALSWN